MPGALTDLWVHPANGLHEELTRQRDPRAAAGLIAAELLARPPTGPADDPVADEIVRGQPPRPAGSTAPGWPGTSGWASAS